MNDDLGQLDWNKSDGLIPVIIQDVQTLQVLMLGYMNEAALKQSLETQKVTFYSRSKQRLWVKGETSGHFLNIIHIAHDCDQDTLLIQVEPVGACCHLNNVSCFGSEEANGVGILGKLTRIISDRQINDSERSYTSQLFNAGVKRIAQKVGEEGVEVALAGVSGVKEDITNESADLLFHLLVLTKYY